jgi:hypothetical protein
MFKAKRDADVWEEARLSRMKLRLCRQNVPESRVNFRLSVPGLWQAVLEEHEDDPVVEEIMSFINSLSEDEQIDLVTLGVDGTR